MNELTKSIQEMNPDELVHLVRDGQPGPGRVARELARRFSAWHRVCEGRDAAEATIAEVRAELIKYFDDIDLDYAGQPNDLDTMVRQAAGQLNEARSWSGKETNRANIAEHKNSQLRSRFALELAARTTPDMVESERMAARITELEAINDGLRKWQNVLRPELESRIKTLKSTQHQQPRLISEAPQDGSEVLAWACHVGWSVLSWSNVRDGWVGHTQEYPTHWVYLPSPVDDTYSRGATP